MKGISFFSDITGDTLLSVFRDPLKKVTFSDSLLCKEKLPYRERWRINAWLGFFNTTQWLYMEAKLDSSCITWTHLQIVFCVRKNTMKQSDSVCYKKNKKLLWRRSIACASSQTSSDSNLEAVQTKCGYESGQKHGKMPKCRWMSMWFTYLTIFSDQAPAGNRKYQHTCAHDIESRIQIS